MLLTIVFAFLNKFSFYLELNITSFSDQLGVLCIYHQFALKSQSELKSLVMRLHTPGIPVCFIFLFFVFPKETILCHPAVVWTGTGSSLGLQYTIATVLQLLL